MKIILGILFLIIIGFFFLPIFPSAGQACQPVYIEGQPPCTFYKETGYEYFFQRGGTFQDLFID